MGGGEKGARGTPRDLGWGSDGVLGVYDLTGAGLQNESAKWRETKEYCLRCPGEQLNTTYLRRGADEGGGMGDPI